MSADPTGLPNGVDIEAGHGGNVAPYVTADGARFAAGTTIVPSGAAGTTIATGLTTVSFLLTSTYGTVAGTLFVTTAGSVVSGGNVNIQGVAAAGTAGGAQGTASWFAIGT